MMHVYIVYCIVIFNRLIESAHRRVDDSEYELCSMCERILVPIPLRKNKEGSNKI